MRKILSLAAAFLVTLSLAGCAMGNNRVIDRNRVGNNYGTNIRRLSEQNNYNNTNVNYRDGVYTGYGNSNANGNDRAIVEIRNGRIVSVDLANVGMQGGTNIIPGTGDINQRGTGVGMNNQIGTNNRTGAGNAITPGNITGPGNTTGTGTNNQGATNNLVGSGNGITYGSTSGTGNPSGTRNTTGTRTDINNTNEINIGGITGGTAGTLDGARTNLVNMIIRDQRYDVNAQSNDANITNTINNWKLAISRALEQARR